MTLVAVAMAAGVALALAPVPTALAAVLLAACRWRQRGGPGRIMRARPHWPQPPGPPRIAVWIALALLAASGCRARAALEEAHGRWADAADALHGPTTCVGEAVVTGSPAVVHTRASKGPRPQGRRARVDLTFVAGCCGERPIGSPVRARLYGVPEALGRGDVIRLVGVLAPVQLFWNPGLRDPRLRLALQGAVISGGEPTVQLIRRGTGLARRMDAVRRSVRERIEATFPSEIAPFARALVLGESDLADLDREAFRRSGLAHLLAVSGTHLVLAVLALVRALRFVLVRIEWLAARRDASRLSAALGVGLCWLYADFAGGGGSAYRAAGMLSCALLARALGRRPCAGRAFALSVAGGALLQPLAMADLSFALSVAATAGLLAVRPVVAALRRASGRVAGAAAAALLSTTAAMVGCAPVLAALGPELPVLGVAANVLAAPVGELAALPLCLVHTLLRWAPDVERGAAVLASGALSVVRAVAHAGASSTLAVVAVPSPSAVQIAFSASLLGFGAVARGRGWRVGGALWVVGLVLVEWAAIRAGAPRGQLRLTMLDVGQGDGALIDFPDGRLMLVDAGGTPHGLGVDPGERVVSPLLRSRRRQRVDVVVISHAHPDHYGGMSAALERVEVGEVWVSPAASKDPSRSALGGLLRELRSRGAILRHPADLCGRPQRFGAARVDLLAPCPGPDPAWSANDNSLVLKIRMGERAALLMGDAEFAAERRLLDRRRQLLHVDLLKVGHHGSRSSSTRPFVECVAPSVALVSCGVRNRFGHPHSETLARLTDTGAAVARTDRGGALVWSTDGERCWWERPGRLRRAAPVR